MKVALCFLVVLCGGVCLSDYSPRVHGARADVQVTVCDEYGAIVSNAEVVVSFLVKPTEENVSKGQTNDKGVFSASCDS